MKKRIVIQFRCDAKTKARAEAKAKLQGVSVSEMLKAYIQQDKV